jgi:hypothetical protein
MFKPAATGTQRGVIDCDGRNGVSRRAFCAAGALSFMGLSLVDLLHKSVLAGETDVAKCDAVILIWLAGGPSHIDTFDPKPGQPTNGPYKALATSADGIQLCEHFPTLAKNMHLASLIRSLTSKEGSHERATYEMHTGYKPLGSIAHPSMGSLVIQQKGRRNEEIPAYVSVGGTSFGAGFLGSNFAPFLIGDVNDPLRNVNFATGIDEERFKRRIDLLNGVDREFSRQANDEAVRDQGGYQRDALRMMWSKSVEAFDLKREEPRHIRDYGDNPFGRSVLMARRLVEKGVRFVEVTLGGWDTHNDGFNAIQNNLSRLDPALGTLLEDMQARGMLKRTMVICAGEFGRTPKINAQDGRDHYPRCFSALIAGGGIKGGHVHGSSDATGSEPKDNPAQIGDLHATMCDALGIDHTKENMTQQGRPIKVVDKGKPIKELFI